MPSKTYTRRKRRPVVPSGVLRGARPSGIERPKSNEPSKRDIAAREALDSVLALFESEELPSTIARTWIARQEGTSPAVNWSLGNQLLMLLAGTTDGRGYRQWQDAGRHVVKGARAFYILGPSTRKIREKDAETGDESDRTIVTGFHAIPVFAYESTEGAPLTPPDYQPPEPAPLSEVAGAWGIRVTYGPMLTQSWLGLYRHNAVGDESIVLASHDESVFLHELSHAAHKRFLAANGRSLANEPTGRKEVVAETVSAVLGRLVGLEIGNVAMARSYVAHYSNGNPGRAAMQALADIQGCLSLILDAANDETAQVAA